MKTGRKKFLAGLLAFAMILTSLPSTVSFAEELGAEDFTQGFEAWFNADGSTSVEAGQIGTYPIYAGEAMSGKTNKITVNGVDHYAIQGSSNPKANGNNPNGAVPTSGAYLKVVAPADGTLTVYGYNNPGKPFYGTKGDTADLIDGNAFGNDTHSYTVSVSGGEEWYFYAQGSKAQFVGVVFELPKAEKEIPVVLAGAYLGDATISFKNVTTNDVVTINASSTSVSLKEGYKYSVSIESAVLTIDLDEVDLTGEIPASITITIEEAKKHSVSGNIMGLAEGMSIASLSFTDEAGTTTVATVDGLAYSVELKNGNYTTSAELVNGNGYTVMDHVAVSGTEGEAVANDVWFYAPAKTYPATYSSEITAGKNGDYKTITEALAAVKAMTRAEGEAVTIKLLDEEYVEQVIVDANNVKLVAAEGVSPTVRWYYGIGYKYYSIDSTGYYNVKNANDKYEMNYAQRWGAVVRVKGNNFLAEGINFVNTFNVRLVEEELGDSRVGNAAEYGQSISGKLKERVTGVDVASEEFVERAAAVALDAQNAEFYKCSFTSSQDTLYTGSSVAYFNDCEITGQTDFIFGNTGCSAVFDNCKLAWLGYTKDAKAGYVTATRGDYLFRGCTLTNNKAAGYSVVPGYLGRPWGNTAAVTFLGCDFENGSVCEEGWASMSGVAPKDAKFFEYGNIMNGKSFFTSYKFELNEEAAKKLADPVNDETYLKTFAPVHHVTKALEFNTGSGSSEEEEQEVVVKTYVLDASKLTAVAQGSKADGETQAAGDEDYFTIIYSAKSKVDSNSKTFSDGFEGTQRINLGGVASTQKNAVKFTTKSKNAVVKVWWVTGDNDRQIAILDVNGDIVTTTSGSTVKNGTNVSELTLAEAGTYYLGGTPNNNYIFKVSVKETLTNESPAQGSAPVIKAVKAEKVDNTVTISWEKEAEGSGDAKINVYVSKDNGVSYSSVKANVGLEETSVEYKLKNSGSYIFKVTGVLGTKENEGKLSEAVDYVLPLGTPVLTVKPSDSSVLASWTKVEEAELYAVSAYLGDQGVALYTTGTETSFKIPDLENGKNYTFDVVAIRGKEVKKSEPVKCTPYAPIDTSNAIPGMTIVNQNEDNSLIVIRDGGKSTVVQPSTSGGIASSKTTNESFIAYKEAVDTDFVFTAKLKITDQSMTGTSGGIFMGAFAGTGETDPLVTLGLRGDGSVNLYRMKTSSRGGSSFSEVKTWSKNTTYTITIERVDNTYSCTISDGKNSETKVFDATDDSATVNTVVPSLQKGKAVIPAIALAGVTADISDIKLVAGDNTLFDSASLEGSFVPFADNWKYVEAPVITDIKVNSKLGTIDVAVDGEIGVTGAGKIEVSMLNESGKKVASQAASTFGTNKQSFTFSPSASGIYSFVATATRASEETAISSEEVKAGEMFVLPMAKASITSAYNKGNGNVAVEWDAVKEAESYIVYVNGKSAGLTQEKSYVVGGLSVGDVVKIQVSAVHGDDEGALSDEVSVTVTSESQKKWNFTTYGPSTDSKNNGFTGSANEESGVTIYSLGGKGKIVPGSCQDGLSFYYTTIDPENENFTLEADIEVDQWTLSNGQDGFGLMVSDTIGKNQDTSVVWNNSLQNIVSKMSYYYDGQDVTSDTTADQITMKLGIGVNARLGITGEDVAYYGKNATFLYADGSTNSIPEGFTTNQYTLETSCAKLGTGTYNIIGNYTSEPSGTQKDKLITKVHLVIKRNNTGYFLTYKDMEGNVIGTKKIYDLDRNALTQIDKDNIYVGIFASRNAKITATNVSLTTINPADDEPAEEREIEYVEPVYTIESATTANTQDYTLIYYGNADGVITVKDAKNNVIADKVAVKANEKSYFTTKLNLGNNKFTVTVTPNSDYEPKAYTKLSSYESKTFSHNVSYKKFNGDNIYVSNKGTSKGNGSKTNPVDVYTAVSYVAPGQKIILLGGTYNLSSTITIARGINGTKEAPIYMIADPQATTRVVFDFGGVTSGMSLAGNYWYFKDFDVTNSKDATKGINLSGSNNVLDGIRAYKNGNTGIQVSRLYVSDKFDEWPANNLILNCSSFLNADKGYEDADGFAAKLSVGEGNVFNGCISAYNADDGWDLYAKSETGKIGKVTIKNSVAFMNGYVLDEKGNVINAGNGNGFKMGGESLSGYHTLVDSIAFANKAKGFDSNSCPDIQVYNSISFDNEGYNVAFYTNMAKNTDFLANGVISYKVSNSVAEQIKPLGTQDKTKIYNATNYFTYGAELAYNTENVNVDSSWFVSLDTDSVRAAAVKEILEGSFGLAGNSSKSGIVRKADGTIETNGYLVLTDKAPKKSDASSYAGLYSNSKVEESASATVEVGGKDSSSLISKKPTVISTVAAKVSNAVSTAVNKTVDTVKKLINKITKKSSKAEEKAEEAVAPAEEASEANEAVETTPEETKEETVIEEDASISEAEVPQAAEKSFPLAPVAGGAVGVLLVVAAAIVLKKRKQL